MTNTESHILFFAFRYALGRETYAPGIVAEELLRRASELTSFDREVYIREISAAEASNGLGHPTLDAPLWMQVRQAMVDAGTEANKKAVQGDLRRESCRKNS